MFGPKLFGATLIGMIFITSFVHPHDQMNDGRLLFVVVGLMSATLVIQVASFLRSDHRHLVFLDFFFWWLVTVLSIPLGVIGFQATAKVVWRLATGDDGTSLPPFSK